MTTLCIVTKRLMALSMLAIFLGGCASLGAKPWQRDLLAKRAMQFDGYDVDHTIDDHIYFSKEATSGGRSVSGGGCGCN
jgi:hypothetical protein